MSSGYFVSFISLFNLLCLLLATHFPPYFAIASSTSCIRKVYSMCKAHILVPSAGSDGMHAFLDGDARVAIRVRTSSVCSSSNVNFFCMISSYFDGSQSYISLFMYLFFCLRMCIYLLLSMYAFIYLSVLIFFHLSIYQCINL